MDRVYPTTFRSGTRLPLAARPMPLQPSGRLVQPARRVAHLPQRAQREEAAAAATSPEAPADEHKAPETLPAPEQELVYSAPDAAQRVLTAFRLLWALPWRRFKQGSALAIKLSGPIVEQTQSRFSSTASLAELCDCLVKGTYDPRVVGLVVKIDPLQCGWAKLQELRRHVALFRASGKWTVAYMERAGEKEYFLASAFGEIYVPPTASLSLRGMSVSGTFLRGVFEKVGVEPEIIRIGKYKSAGDQLLRKDMSDAQREQLSALLDDIYGTFLRDVAAARGKTPDQVAALLDEGAYDPARFVEGAWVTGLKYEDELNKIIEERTGGKEDEMRVVKYKRYVRVSRGAFGLNSGKTIAVLRSSGAIVGGSGGGSSITSGEVIAQLRALKKDKRVAAVVVRIDSPGGDALASDLMWREVRQLAAEKPVVASMGDVAASGGYYLAMGAPTVVCEPLTITGSIGVITGKVNLAELYRRAGYTKQLLSRGRYAELLAESRSMTPDEATLFGKSAEHAYASFRDKAAESRGMSIDAMQEVAQGRVWSGTAALEVGLVDALGGVARAVALAKHAAGIPRDERVRVQEVSRGQLSPLALVTGGGAAASLRTLGALCLALLGGSGSEALATAAGAPALLRLLGSAAGDAFGDGDGEALLSSLAAGQPLALGSGLEVDGVASRALSALPSWGSPSGGGELFD